MAPISPTHMKQLAYIRLLYKQAVEQSERSEPFCSFSLLGFDDAAEMFLWLAKLRHNVNTKAKPVLRDLWDAIASTPGIGALSERASILHLHETRNTLKHKAVQPSKLAIEGFRASATAFFTANCPVLFGVEFDDVTLIDLVAYEVVREDLTKATAHFSNGEKSEAFEHLALAFFELRRNFLDGKGPAFEQPRVENYFYSHAPTGSRFGDRAGPSRQVIRHLEELGRAVETLSERLAILSLGLDYRRYSQFRYLVPSLQWAQGGYFSDSRDYGQRSQDDFDGCVEFIVDAALHLQGSDFDTIFPKTDPARYIPRKRVSGGLTIRRVDDEEPRPE